MNKNSGLFKLLRATLLLFIPVYLSLCPPSRRDPKGNLPTFRTTQSQVAGEARRRNHQADCFVRNVEEQSTLGNAGLPRSISHSAERISSSSHIPLRISSAGRGYPPACTIFVAVPLPFPLVFYDVSPRRSRAG